MLTSRSQIGGSSRDGNTAESLLYDLISGVASLGKRFSISARNVDEHSVDASVVLAVNQRLASLSIDPQSCEFEFSEVTYGDPQEGIPAREVYFVGVERRAWLGGYVVATGVIVAKLESESSGSRDSK